MKTKEKQMSNTTKRNLTKSLLLDAGNVTLFVGGFLVLDSIVYAVPNETLMGGAIALGASVLRYIAKAVK